MQRYLQWTRTADARRARRAEARARRVAMVAQAERRHARSEESRSAFAAAHACGRACICAAIRSGRSNRCRGVANDAAGAGRARLVPAVVRAAHRCALPASTRRTLMAFNGPALAAAAPSSAQGAGEGSHRAQAATRSGRRGRRDVGDARGDRRVRECCDGVGCIAASRDDAGLAGRGGAVRRARRRALRHRFDSAPTGDGSSPRTRRCVRWRGICWADRWQRAPDAKAAAAQAPARAGVDSPVRRGAAAHSLLRPAADAAQFRRSSATCARSAAACRRAASVSGRTCGCPKSGSRRTACPASPCRSTWRIRACSAWSGASWARSKAATPTG